MAMSYDVNTNQMVDHRIDKPLVTSALSKLGADRVMAAHVALEHGSKGDWNGCFLAIAYGGYGRLAKVLGHADPDYGVSEVLGLSNLEVWAVVEAYDHCRAEFQVLVEEWLELNYLPKDNPAIIARDMLIAAYGRENVDVAGCNRAAKYYDEPVSA